MYSNLYILINLVIETRDNLLSQIYDYLNSIEKDKIKISIHLIKEKIFIIINKKVDFIFYKILFHQKR